METTRPPIPPRMPQNYPPLAAAHSGGSHFLPPRGSQAQSQQFLPPTVPARAFSAAGPLVQTPSFLSPTSSVPPIPAVPPTLGQHISPTSTPTRPSEPISSSSSNTSTLPHTKDEGGQPSIKVDGHSTPPKKVQGGPIVELKLVLLGHVGAGKTRLLNRMLSSFRGASLGGIELHRRQHDEPSRQGAGSSGNESDGDDDHDHHEEEGDCEPTVGANYLVKLISLYGTSVKCSLWDVTGAEHFVDSLGHMFYRGAQVVVFVFDVTDIGSFIHAKKLIEEVTSDGNYNTAEPLLVGTKCDKLNERQVQEKEVRTWAQGKHITYYETSALWPDDKMQALLRDIAEAGLKKLLDSPTSSSTTIAAQATSLPEWVPDSSGNSCTSCGAYFHFSLRRHHCRRTQKVALPAFGLARPVRVCDTCYHAELKTMMNH